MKKKWMSGFALGLCCMFVMTGCAIGTPSAKQILDKSAKTMQDVHSMKFVMDMDYAMDVSIAGQQTSLTLGLDAFEVSTVTTQTGELEAGHMKGSMSVGAEGVGDFTVPLECYVEKDGTSLVQYVSASNAGWTKETLAEDMQEGFDSIFDFAASYASDTGKESDAWKVSKKLVDINGTKAYQLTTVVDDKKMLDVVHNTLGLDSMTNMDISLGDMTVMQYIDKKDGYLVGMDVQVAGSSSDEKETKPEQEKTGENAVPAFDSMTLTVNEMNFSVRCEKINGLTAKDLAVPKKIKESSRETLSAGLGMFDETLLSQGVDVPDTDVWNTESVSEMDGVQTLEKDGYTLFFDGSDFENVKTENGQILATSSDFQTTMTAAIRTAFSGKDSVEQDRKSTDEYLKSEKEAGTVKDINISDRKTTTLGAYKVYYFSEQYTDCSLNASGDFVSKEYHFYIDCGDNEHVGVISVSEVSDVAAQVNLNDTVALEILSDFAME